MDIEKYMHHLPDCDCLKNTSCKVPCTCGRDAAVEEIRKAINENILIRQAFAQLHLTIFHMGPMG